MANEKGPGKSPHDGDSPLLQVGGCLSFIGGTGRQLEQIPGCYPSCGTAITSPSGFSSSPFSHLSIISDLLGRISSITGLAPGGRKDVVRGVLRNRPRSGSRLLQSSFPGGKGDVSWRPMINLSHLNEFVLQTLFKMETVASVLLSVHPRGGFSSFHRFEGRIFPDTRSSVVEEAIEVPVGGLQ